MAERICTCEPAEQFDLSLLAPVLDEYADDAGALIPVLQHAQEIYGYLPREVLLEIAEKRDAPFSEVYGVATFYGLFHLEPRGKTIVRLCHGTACHVAGAPDVARAITDELGVRVGETSADMKYTIEAVACVGCCVAAPVVLIDDQVHAHVAPASARKLAKQIRREADK